MREKVVQAICNTFLENHCSTTFHPYSDGRRMPTLYVDTLDKRGGFEKASWADDHKGYVRVHGAEMKAAFDILQSAGYFMFRVYTYGSWLGYECSKKPFMEKGERVTEFNDFID